MDIILYSLINATKKLPYLERFIVDEIFQKIIKKQYDLFAEIILFPLDRFLKFPKNHLNVLEII